MNLGMIRRTCLWSLLVALAPMSVYAAGASYFVSQSGAGSQNGSTLANAWPVAIYNASSLPTGGDTVTFFGTITSTVAPRTGGTGNGTSRLTLDFSGATLNAVDPRINVNGQNYLTLSGGAFGTASSGALITFNNTQTHDVTIDHWTHVGASNSTAQFISGYYCYNLTVSNNTVDNLGGFVAGDTVFNHDISILNNYARTSLNTTSQTDIVFYGDAYNVTIQGNKFINRTEGATSTRHNDVLQCYQKGGGNSGSPHNWIVRYNWLEMAAATGSGDNSWVMFENMSGDPAAKIYSNVFVGTGNAGNNGLAPNSNSSTAAFYFYNNTIIRHKNPDNTIRFLSPGILYSRNNVGEADAGQSGTFLSWGMTPGAAWNRNWFYQFGGCSGTYSGANGSCTTDPKFADYQNNNFALQQSSPLIGAGDAAIGAEYNQGIAASATWPNPALVARSSGAWDIGAFQSGGAVVPGLTPPTALTVVVH